MQATVLWISQEAKSFEICEMRYNFRSGAVHDAVGLLRWLYSSPLTIMLTIHPGSGEDSLALRMI